MGERLTVSNVGLILDGVLCFIEHLKIRGAVVAFVAKYPQVSAEVADLIRAAKVLAEELRKLKD